MSLKQKLNIIFNPNAGNGRSEKARKIIEQILQEKAITYEVFKSESEDKAKIILDGLLTNGQKNIIVIGGDGTFSAIVNSCNDPSQFVFGLIPSGTGNDFAKTLGISKNPKKALEHILSGKQCQVDYLQGTSRRAVNTVSAGIDIAIITKYESYNQQKNKRTKGSYYKALLSTMFKYKCEKFFVQKSDTINFDASSFDNVKKQETITPVDDKNSQPNPNNQDNLSNPPPYSYTEIDSNQTNESNGYQMVGDREYFCVAVCNGQYFGSGMKVSPHSKLDDGIIHLVCIHSLRRLKILTSMLQFLKGKHIKKSYCDEFLCQSVLVNKGEKMTVNYDGELKHNEPFCINIVKNGLNIFHNTNKV